MNNLHPETSAKKARMGGCNSKL